MRDPSPLRAERGGEVVQVGEHQVAIAFDPDGETWLVTASSVPGLAGEATTREELLDALPHLIGEATLP